MMLPTTRPQILQDNLPQLSQICTPSQAVTTHTHAGPASKRFRNEALYSGSVAPFPVPLNAMTLIVLSSRTDSELMPYPLSVHEDFLSADLAESQSILRQVLCVSLRRGHRVGSAAIVVVIGTARMSAAPCLQHKNSTVSPMILMEMGHNFDLLPSR